MGALLQLSELASAPIGWGHTLWVGQGQEQTPGGPQVDRAQWEGAGEGMLALPASAARTVGVEEMGPEWGDLPQACGKSGTPGLHTPHPGGRGGRAGRGLERGCPGTSHLRPIFADTVVVEGERGNRPHIYCLEQLLQEAVRAGPRGLLQER